MPIDYKEYHPDWKAISLRIRTERAQNKCEWCGVANRDIYFAIDGVRVRHDGSQYHDQLVMDCGLKCTKIVLTVAHIDHDKTNDDDSNLAALCQSCHLNHDRKQHAESRKYGKNWKRDQTKLDLL